MICQCHPYSLPVIMAKTIRLIDNNRELKPATILLTRTPARSKSSRYRWRMMASAVLF